MGHQRKEEMDKSDKRALWVSRCLRWTFIICTVIFVAVHTIDDLPWTTVLFAFVVGHLNGKAKMAEEYYLTPMRE